MIQPSRPGDDLRLALKASPEAVILARDFALKDFDGDIAAHHGIIGQVNGGHPTAAQPGPDLKTPDTFPIHHPPQPG